MVHSMRKCNGVDKSLKVRQTLISLISLIPSSWYSLIQEVEINTEGALFDHCGDAAMEAHLSLIVTTRPFSIYSISQASRSTG